jgi:DNA-binding LytR/AlgR family response regulator
MKKILIIEDEEINAQRLEMMIGRIDKTALIDGPLKTVEEVVSKLKYHNEYDIIFSDIRLLNGSVFDAFNQIAPNSVVVFTTAYDEYAMQAIQNNGIAYLLKPIDDDELRETMERIKNLTESISQQQVRLKKMMHDVNYKKRLLVYRLDELIPICVDEILYFYKDERRVLVRTNDGNEYTINASMTDLEEQLDPNMFFRINRQYITQVKGIERITQYFNSKLRVILRYNNDNELILSRERSALLKNWLNR